jgi:acetolactate synthase-1/2/3 large subunit
MNGTAHALLDRVPVVVITDCEGAAQPEGMHQVFDQLALFAPVTKFSRRLCAENFAETAVALTAALKELPAGPVHLDVPGSFTSK